MNLVLLDWIVIVLYLVVSIFIGVFLIKHKNSNITDFFVAGRSLPWWLLGTSIAATWFATDAPLAVTALVRTKGIYSNWLWWYLGTGIMMMVFFYAKNWRRAEILTDAELIELRYSGKSASTLRAFTAGFYGIFKNCITLGWVILAMLKFSSVMLGWSAEYALLITLTFALLHTLISGIRGVVVLDMFHFTVGTLSTIILAFMILMKIGGPKALSNKIIASTDAPPAILDMMPNISNIDSIEMISFLCLIGILWLGQAQGDGFIVQRLFSAKNEKHAIKASLWFAVAGIVILTWPWIVVGLGSIVLLPISTAPVELISDPELAYPMMIVEVLPSGLKGLLVAAFMAAFMSTVDTHLCWGASYMVNDIYKRFIKKNESDKHYLLVSRISIVLLLLLSGFTAWQMDSISNAWIYIIEVMSGVAIIGMLRWYWWRINAWSEITSMISALVLANGLLILNILGNIGLINQIIIDKLSVLYDDEYSLIRAALILVISTILSLIVTFLTKPVDKNHLIKFYQKIRPKGYWGPISKHIENNYKPKLNIKYNWFGFALGVLFLNSILFSVGHLVIGNYFISFLLLIFGFILATLATKILEKIFTEDI